MSKNGSDDYGSVMTSTNTLSMSLSAKQVPRTLRLDTPVT